MRKYFNTSIMEIETAISSLSPTSIVFAEYLDELRHRSSKRARELLEVCSQRRMQAQAQAYKAAKYQTPDDFAARLKALLVEVDISNARLMEVISTLERKRIEGSSAQTGWIDEYRLRKEQDSRRLAEESESQRLKNEQFWSEFAQTQKRELAIRERFLALHTDQLMELFESGEWDSYEEERLLVAVLRQRILN